MAQAFASTKCGATWSKREPVFSLYAPAKLELDALLSPDIAHSLQLCQPRLQILPSLSDLSGPSGPSGPSDPSGYGLEGGWIVKQASLHAGLRQGAPVLFPFVTTGEALLYTLERAWESRQVKGMGRTVEEGG